MTDLSLFAFVLLVLVFVANRQVSRLVRPKADDDRKLLAALASECAQLADEVKLLHARQLKMGSTVNSLALNEGFKVQDDDAGRAKTRS